MDFPSSLTLVLVTKPYQSHKAPIIDAQRRWPKRLYIIIGRLSHAAC